MKMKGLDKGITALQIIKKQHELLLLFDDILIATGERQKYVKEIKGY